MATNEFRIFLSAVTSEFGKARDALAADLRSREALVRVQSDFRQEAGSDTTLKKLHDYIHDCSAVVCIIGARSGGFPPPAAAAPFLKMLPSGMAEASYTQWEFFFARHHKRRLSIYIANSDYVPDQPVPTGEDRLDLQQALIRHIVKEQGLDRSYFSNVDQLCRTVLKEDWPRKRPVKPILLPYPSLGSMFKGRGALMEEMRKSLTRDAHGGVISTALYGLGGIGKTRAAVEYAWAYHEKYTALLFVIAETPEALWRNLAALVDPLDLAERDAREEEVRLRAMLDGLNANPGWLLILDSIDTNPALVEVGQLIGQFAGGHVVITSRLANFPAEVQALEVDVLDVNDAADFLLERTAGHRRQAADDDARSRELAVDLGRLALALEHAGAYIVRHRASVSQYRELWQGSRDKIMSWSDPAVTHYPHAIAATWQTSVAQLSNAARCLLERLAWLAPEPVPEFLLDVPIPEAEAEDFQEALADLAAYSLARHDVENPRFLVHRLVQEVTRSSLDDDASRRRLIEALRWVDAGFSGDPQDVRSWPRLDSLVPHARAVVGSADNAGVPRQTTRLMNQLGLLLHEKGLYTEAEPLYRRALVIDEKSLGPDHPNVARDTNNLALLLQATNRLAEAEPLTRRALAIDEKNLGPDHPNVAIRLSNLAWLLKETNRLAEAEPLMRRALAIDETSLGPNHPNVAIRLSNLAQLLQATNRLAEAEPLMRRALAIDEKSLGSDHPGFATDLSNLAQLLQATNRLAEAEPLMRRALAISETSFGPDHPNVARDTNNLAQLLHDTSRLAEAEPLMQRALAIVKKSFGPEHHNVAIGLNNLASLLQATNRLAEAEPLMRRALAIDEKSLGSDHPGFATDLSNLAQLLQATNRLAEAEPLMRRALAIDEASFGPDHPKVAIRLDNLAHLLQATNQLADADPLMRRALAIVEKSFGPEHHNVAIGLNNLASLLQATNRLAEAEPLMRRALAIDEKSLGSDHPGFATDLNNLAQLLQATNRLAEAEPLMRRAAQILHRFERANGRRHPNHDLFEANYTRLLAAMG